MESYHLGPSDITNELPRSKLRGIRTNRESLAQLSPPHVSSGGPVLTSPGFPLKACGNDGLRKGNKFYAASCGELDPVEINKRGNRGCLRWVKRKGILCPIAGSFWPKPEIENKKREQGESFNEDP